MGNHISKTNKDHFLLLKRRRKIKLFFEKGKVRRGLDMATGGTYMKLYSIKIYSKNAGPITNWDVVVKPFLKTS